MSAGLSLLPIREPSEQTPLCERWICCPVRIAGAVFVQSCHRMIHEREVVLLVDSLWRLRGLPN